MFTGIVEGSVRIVSITQGAGFFRLTVAAGFGDVQRGESIAVNGVCLTVAEIVVPSLDLPVEAIPTGVGTSRLPGSRDAGVATTRKDVGQTASGGSPPAILGFDVIPETLARTNLGLLQENQTVHIERALRASGRISGHFLQGHVDGQARLVSLRNEDGDCRLIVAPPIELMKYIIPKGSVALDGVSLTVASVARDQVEVALIPTTRQLTHLGAVPVGWPFNLETDILAKTVVSWLEQMGLEAKAPNTKAPSSK
jgi:riboflavin synthase